MRRELQTALQILIGAGVAAGVGTALQGTAFAADAANGTARAWVNVRNAPHGTALSVGSLSTGQKVTVLCRTTGTTVNGPGGATALWDKLGEGRYVSHSYVNSGTAAVARCDAPAPAPAPTVRLTATATPTPTVTATSAPAATNATARAWVNVRSAPSGTAAAVGSLSTNQPVTVTCQTAGTKVNGPGGVSTDWDKIGEGRWVAHSYLNVAAGPLPKCDASGKVIEKPVPAPKAGLTAEQTAFLNTIAGPAMKNFTESKVPASVTIAQAILESGWGKGEIPRTAHNFYGAKCSPGNVPGPVAVGCRTFPTRECNATKCWDAVGSFKVFASVLDSTRDHARILTTNKRYAAAFAYSADPSRFAAEVHKAGYASDPNYTTQLVQIMVKFDLYRYDK
ncbi:hypothetical protein Val02_38010 [Virgisporangium aliadipatigenens]|uniref:Flagellar protein FlgJ n=1 Tax=Virgisporangium aliadipatigenens TaxID=741659 RepID=A0A8J4DQD1_9ACTN|nr:glucosaminidase domain-containing protein [Virgisporangium aliadipatigenens]GIJ46915.1 hypothetical protein Val02_38010 [Virgisporangium aliadipatigenens]